MTWETGGFERPSTITLVLQVNQLTKCASHPKLINSINFEKKSIVTRNVDQIFIRNLITELFVRNFDKICVLTAGYTKPYSEKSLKAVNDTPATEI